MLKSWNNRVTCRHPRLPLSTQVPTPTHVLPPWSPPRDILTLFIISAVFLPPPASSFHPGESTAFHRRLHLLCHSWFASPLLRLFVSCARGNHPWKMFWPSIIATSRMFPISLTPEPRACWTDAWEMGLYAHTQSLYSHLLKHPPWQ